MSEADRVNIGNRLAESDVLLPSDALRMEAVGARAAVSLVAEVSLTVRATTKCRVALSEVVVVSLAVRAPPEGARTAESVVTEVSLPVR